MMKSLPWKKSTTATTRIKTSSPKQDYVPEIAIGVLANAVTKQYKYLRALIDSGSSSSIICESSMPDPASQEENQRQSFRRNKMDNQGWNLCYNRRSKHLVLTHQICPQRSIQTQVQSRP
jgi:hypothetical protein